MAKFPDHLSGRVTLGWALLDLGRYDEARGELEQVLKRAPDNLAAIRGLAELHDRAESTMYLDMPSPSAWPPEPSASETDDTPAQEFARHVAEAETHEPDPVWQAPPAPAAPAPIPVALASEAEPPQFITTAQAAMQDLPRPSDARVAADVLDATAAPIELVSTTEAAFARVDAGPDAHAGARAVASVELDAPVVIETAAQAIAPRASKAAPSTVELDPVQLASPADFLATAPEAMAVEARTPLAATAPVVVAAPEPAEAVEFQVAAASEPAEAVDFEVAAVTEPEVASLDDDQTLDLVAALTAGAGEIDVAEPISAAPAFEAVLDDDLDQVIAALSETPGIVDAAPSASLADAVVVASADDGFDADLTSALADAGAASAAAAFEAAQQSAADREAEMTLARHDVAAVAPDAGAEHAFDRFEQAESAAPRVELDLVPADAVDAMAAAAEVAANLERAAAELDAGDDVNADAGATVARSGATDHGSRFHEMPAGDADFVFAQQTALGRTDEPADEVEPPAATNLDRDTPDAGGFFGADAFPQPAFEPLAIEPAASDRNADDLAAAMTAAGEWEPPVAAAPAVVDAAETEAPAAAMAATAGWEPPAAAVPVVVESVEIDMDAAAMAAAGEWEPPATAAASAADAVEIEAVAAAMSPASADWEPPVAAMPVVVEAVEIETPVAAFEATPAPVGAVAVEAHVEPPAPAPAPDIVDDILELATADPSAVEPLVDLELGAPETGSPLESLVLLELGDASAPAAMAPVDVALSAAVSLPELELLELTPLPEPPAVVVSPEPIAAAPALFEAEPHRSDAASAYDVTREAESPRSGRASKGRRKGKAAAAKTSPVAALEHLLRRVETRRAEITSESVA